MKRDTKRIGDISELLVIAAFVRAGYHIAIPYGENQRYDFIADRSGSLLRIQVKTGRLRNGVIMFNCHSTHEHRGGSMRGYRGEIDLFAVYCAEVEAVLIVPVDHFNLKGHVRWEATRNRQRAKIRWASDYQLLPITPPELVGGTGADGVP